MVAAVLVLLAWRSLSPPPAATHPRRGTPLLGMAPDELRSIEVIRDDGSLRFSRQGTQWVAEDAAGGARMPDDRIDPFLATLAGLDRLVEIGGEAPDLRDFGLDPPRGTVVLRDGVETRIQVGERNPALTGVYVRLPPDPRVFLVGAVLDWELKKLAAPAPAQTKE